VTASTSDLLDAAVKAESLTKGDAASLSRAQQQFTTEGWSDYRKTLKGFIDDKGAPELSQEFIPGAAPAIFSDAGTIHAAIPGTLKQNGTGSASYHGVLQVDAIGNPPKIVHIRMMIRAAKP
jgi:hypothetical protein